MSTYFFKTNLQSNNIESIKPKMDELAQSGDIESWNVALDSPEKILQVETNTLSPDKVKHLLREAGYEAEFTTAPQAR